jgi:hypothetical protein
MVEGGSVSAKPGRILPFFFDLFDQGDIPNK